LYFADKNFVFCTIITQWNVAYKEYFAHFLDRAVHVFDVYYIRHKHDMV